MLMVDSDNSAPSPGSSRLPHVSAALHLLQHLPTCDQHNAPTRAQDLQRVLASLHSATSSTAMFCQARGPHDSKLYQGFDNSIPLLDASAATHFAWASTAPPLSTRIHLLPPGQSEQLLDRQLIRAHRGQSMGQGGAAAAGQSVQALAGHGRGLGGGQQQLCAVAVEGDERHLVPALVALRQQPDGRALRVAPCEDRVAGRTIAVDQGTSMLARQPPATAMLSCSQPGRQDHASRWVRIWPAPYVTACSSRAGRSMLEERPGHGTTP